MKKLLLLLWVVMISASVVGSGIVHAKGKRMEATVTGPFRIEVDYSQSLGEMVVAGEYDWTGYGG